MVSTVHRLKPQTVLLIVGENDVAQRHFSPRQLTQYFEELTLGMSAAGAQNIYVFPTPSRNTFRVGGATAAVYRRRRRMVNQILRRHFYRPVAASHAAYCHFKPSVGFIGSDDVHPSAVGWEEIRQVIVNVTSALTHE